MQGARATRLPPAHPGELTFAPPVRGFAIVEYNVWPIGFNYPQR
jgi:hypothetical protein